MADEPQAPVVVSPVDYPEIHRRLEQGWVMEVGWTPDRDYYVIFEKSDGIYTGFYSMADLSELPQALGEAECDLKNGDLR